MAPGPQQRPTLINVAFWVAFTQVTVFFVLSFGGAHEPLQLAIHGANIALVAVLWFFLPWDAAAPRGAKLFSPLFLVLSFALGVTGSNGEQFLLPWLAFANITFVFGLRAVLVSLTIVALTLGATSVGVFHNTIETGFRVAMDVAVIGLFVVGMAMAVAEARNRRAEALRLNAKIKQLAASEERARIAGDMHDSVGHHLTVIKINLENAERLRDRSETMAWSQVEGAKHVAVEALADVRRWVRVLKPAELSEGVHSEVLESFARSVAGTGLTLEFQISGEERNMGSATDLILYRAIQESLTNTLKHARASVVEIDLEYTDVSVSLAVRDDGRSTAPAEPAFGFGLNSLHERVHAAGGSFSAGFTSDERGERDGYRLALELPAVQG